MEIVRQKFFNHEILPACAIGMTDRFKILTICGHLRSINVLSQCILVRAFRGEL
ncbi:MAG: hypothetical protein QME42_03460 [bacterium]|nr:hypothetical protein [bacterium]